MRLSERFPTVEVRVFDAQLDAEDSVLAALLCHALVVSDDRSLEHDRTDGIDDSLWNAARSGMNARLIDPTTGEAVYTWSAVDRMLAASAPALRELDDEDFVLERLAHLRTDGTGATRQRVAFAREGTRGLAALLSADTPAPAPGNDLATAR